ncbi:MAG: hypothetical protein JSW01_02485 [Candidatus Bathyarchaeota archaeon]|nr:MAG: hypothetical protein JSW01_02485 [Candidatus Bathyarchaeota archaeon]
MTRKVQRQTTRKGIAVHRENLSLIKIPMKLPLSALVNNYEQEWMKG